VAGTAVTQRSRGQEIIESAPNVRYPWGVAWRGVVAAIIVVVSSAGCPPAVVTGARPEPAPPAPSAPAPTVAGRGRDIGSACREQVADLKDWLAAIEGAGLPLAVSLLDEGAHLVEREGAPVSEPAPLVHLTTAKVYLDGMPVADAAGLGKELAALIELRREMAPESPFIKSPRCYLAIDGDVSWERVVGIAGAVAAAGVARATFVFIDPVRSVPLPPASSIDGDLERMKQGTAPRRAQIIAELVAYVYQDCPEALRVIASLGANPVADFKQVILDELPDAIAGCGCGADLAAVKSLHWALFGNPRPMSGVTLELPSTTDPEPRALEQPAETSWAAANAAIVAASSQGEQPLRLAVAPAAKPAKKRER
jgi:hypothetical protein